MKPRTSRAQIGLDFEESLTERFRTLRSVMAAVVYQSKIGLDGCAAACDVSPSTLSRMLNEQDEVENKRNFPADFIAPIVMKTNDARPLQWLNEKCTPDEATRIERVLSKAEIVLPAIEEFVKLVPALKAMRKP